MISISFDKEEYNPGETIKATIKLALAKPTKARGLVAELYCTEVKKVVESHMVSDWEAQQRRDLGLHHDTAVKSETSYEQAVVHKQVKKVIGEGIFFNEGFEVEFALPKDAPFTSIEYGHDNKTDVWKVRVKLDIPMAPDEHAEKEIFVKGLGD